MAQVPEDAHTLKDHVRGGTSSYTIVSCRVEQFFSPRYADTPDTKGVYSSIELLPGSNMMGVHLRLNLRFFLGRGRVFYNGISIYFGLTLATELSESMDITSSPLNKIGKSELIDSFEYFNL